MFLQNKNLRSSTLTESAACKSMTLMNCYIFNNMKTCTLKYFSEVKAFSTDICVINLCYISNSRIRSQIFVSRKMIFFSQNLNLFITGKWKFSCHTILKMVRLITMPIFPLYIKGDINGHTLDKEWHTSEVWYIQHTLRKSKYTRKALAYANISSWSQKDS